MRGSLEVWPLPVWPSFGSAGWRSTVLPGPLDRVCSHQPRGARWLGFLLALVLCPAAVEAEPFHLQPAWVGWHASLAINQRGRDMGAGVAFACWPLPWAQIHRAGWEIDPYLTAGLGWLGGRGATAGLARMGPALSLRHAGSPFWIELGISPTVLTRHTFGGLDLGIGLQFTSYAGMNWDISRRLGLGYRFEHMSNASLSSSNPGLNSHTFTIYYRF